MTPFSIGRAWRLRRGAPPKERDARPRPAPTPADAAKAAAGAAAEFSSWTRRPSAESLSRVRETCAAAWETAAAAERDASARPALARACREAGRSASRLSQGAGSLAALGAEPDVFLRETARALAEGLADLAAAMSEPRAGPRLLARARNRLEACGDLRRESAAHARGTGTVAAMRRDAASRHLLDAAERALACVEAAAEALLADAAKASPRALGGIA